MKQLKESDLQIGDILIFENYDFNLFKFIEELSDPESAAFYLLLYLIPWFDPGDDPDNYKNIYHAAIWGNVDVNRGKMGASVQNLNRIVQAGRSGIGQAELEATLKDDEVKNIYVYRFKNKDANFEENINNIVRKFYNQTSIKYSYNTAWMLAVICSLRYENGALRDYLVSKIGAAAADKMIEAFQNIINKYNEDHQNEMVACSTLVAMIFKDAGYPLKIKDFEKLIPFNAEVDSSLIPNHIEEVELDNSDLEVPNIDKTFVTPRQLFESESVEEVGFLHFE